MTLTSLFGGGHIARDPASMVDNVEYYNLDRGDMHHKHEWKGTKSDMKKTKSTLSALTLLAFLFFLNLLLTCLKDTVQSGSPDIIVMPQQRVTRGVLSAQLTGAVQGDAPVQDDAEKKVTRGALSGQMTEAVQGDAVEKVAPSIWSRIVQSYQRGGNQSTSWWSKSKVRVRRGENEEKSRIDKLRTRFWPCCSTEDSKDVRKSRKMKHNDIDLPGEAYETSLEKPDSLHVTTEKTAGGHVKMEGFPRWGPLRYEGVEPEYLEWEAVEDGGQLQDVEEEESGGLNPDREWEKKGYTKEKEKDDSREGDDEGFQKGNKLKDNPSEGNAADDLEDADGFESQEDEDEDEEDEEHALLPATQHSPWEILLLELSRRFSARNDDEPPPLSLWEILRVFLEGLGRSVAGKGWEESLESLDVPGSQFFQVRDHLMQMAMPIVRDTSTKLGLARCKELIVCETSRLSEFFADEEVTSIFHDVFKWIYGMKDPELRSITKDVEEQNNCKQFVGRCKSETRNNSWLPMIANLLDFFIT